MGSALLERCGGNHPAHRQEAVVAKVLEQRGELRGLVHVILCDGGVLEGCDTYKP